MSQHADFEALVAAYAPDLYRYACWLCRDEQRAEDLVQETLLRAWRKFGQLRNLAAAKAWLITTLRREHYRHRPATMLASFDQDVIGEIDAPESLSIADTLDIEARLQNLPASYREVLVLQLLFGYTIHEIADLLKLTEPAVANRLLRARRALLAAPTANVVPLRGARS